MIVYTILMRVCFAPVRGRRRPGASWENRATEDISQASLNKFNNLPTLSEVHTRGSSSNFPLVSFSSCNGSIFPARSASGTASSGRGVGTEWQRRWAARFFVPGSESLGAK